MKKRKGYALIVTIYVIIIFSVIGITVVAFIAGESIANALALNSLKALHIAEGGAKYVLVNDLVTSSAWSVLDGQTHSNINLGEGIFDTVIRSISDAACTIEATGYINKGNLFSEIKREVHLEVTKQYEEGMSSVVYASGRINLGGTEGEVNGDLVSGSDINIDVDGVYTLSSNESISLPTINWAGLQAVAQLQGNYYGGNLNLVSGQTVNGVYYVEGNVSIADHVTVNGSIISRGNINMNQAEHLMISAEAGYPALVADGTINGTQIEDSYINGLIYSSGDITLNVVEEVDLVGAIITGGRVSIVNGEDFNLGYNEDVQNNLYIGSPALITITKWTNL